VLSARGGNPPSASGGSGGGTVTLRGVTGYDPDGTGPPGEHNATAPLATDGDQKTFWATETYLSPEFGGLKSGVGLVLDASEVFTAVAYPGAASVTPPRGRARVSTHDWMVAAALITRPCACPGAACWSAVSPTAPNTEPAAPHANAPA